MDSGAPARDRGAVYRDGADAPAPARYGPRWRSSPCSSSATRSAWCRRKAGSGGERLPQAARGAAPTTLIVVTTRGTRRPAAHDRSRVVTVRVPTLSRADVEAFLEDLQCSDAWVPFLGRSRRAGDGAPGELLSGESTATASLRAAGCSRQRSNRVAGRIAERLKAAARQGVAGARGRVQRYAGRNGGTDHRRVRALVAVATVRSPPNRRRNGAGEERETQARGNVSPQLIGAAARRRSPPGVPSMSERATRATGRRRGAAKRGGRGVSGDGLSHVDSAGNFRMVDVTEKPFRTGSRSPPARSACGRKHSTRSGQHVDKGDVIPVARLAGIQAAKRTADLIPLCHPLPLSSIEVGLKSKSVTRIAGRGPG